MSPITELVILFLKAGANIEDQSTPEGQIAQEALTTISSQPGFQHLYYGPVLEDASLFQLFVSAYSQDFQRMCLLVAIIASKLLIYHCVHVHLLT
jgi:hypothetical protein